MKREIRRKLIQIDETYRKNRLQIEEKLDELSDEQKKFHFYLESIFERMNVTSAHYEENQIDKRKIYNLIEHAEEESLQLTKNIKNKLEDRLDENQMLYSRKIRYYEEEERLLKKKGGYDNG
ncbi:hypothetical protein [Listeria welshimeri]|uniref:hypothetical protein n=1 Tax=Listeria welshimeri TaxID=1643 RepID=UPI0018887A6A|nr:hypothetical protein [Listeria welshimeri]MBF2457473.1 hypothetical protein [Listeria welshimeri]MBF2570144.1 hypothetical protein [Listeria welshimeri]